MRVTRPWAWFSAAAVLAVGALLGVPGAAAHAAPGCDSSTASLTIALPDGSQQTVTAAQICDNADIFNTEYADQAASGQTTPIQVAQGLSIDGLLSLLNPGVDLSQVKFVSITRPDGTLSTLDAADLATPSDFVNGLQPVVYVNGNVIDYLRPQRSASDANADDYLQSPSGGSLSFGVHSGPLLDVTAFVNRDTVHPKTPVHFTAEVSNPPAASQPLSYSWTLGDAATATTAHVTHAFATVGSYDAQVTVTGPDGSEGVSSQIQVVVYTHSLPPPGGGHSGGGGHHPGGPPSSPPGGGNGHHGGVKPTKPPAGNGNSTGNGGGGGIGLPTPTFTIPPGGGSTTTEPLFTTTGQSPQVADGPAIVAGRLIGPGTMLLAGDSQPESSSGTLTTPASQPHDSTGPNLWPIIGGIEALMVLFGFGAIRERRALTRKHREPAGP